MTHASSTRAAAALVAIAGWRSAYDFDAPGLTARERVKRLRTAVLAAMKRNLDPTLEAELSYALYDCDDLLSLSALEGDLADARQVEQRIARIRRIVCHHEGAVDSLNRRYWWIPFSILLGMMVLSRAADLAPLLGALVP